MEVDDARRKEADNFLGDNFAVADEHASDRLQGADVIGDIV